MWGKATLATEESRTTMNVEVMTAAAMAQGLAEGVHWAGAGPAGVAAALKRAVRRDAELLREKAC